ncbi:ubiquitin specific protease 16/45 isoform X2 [Megachile rotundata]|uniref:ubiquitin specific protease 16/45 isoform X2 n=1 Tax=Megachile rotundata TaxID=143995 RepID=UPI000614C9B7|nr:PREDICTED: ubiquitin carboxyl-terminal hydrolase 45 isoform X2 [Megachile rotundata]
MSKKRNRQSDPNGDLSDGSTDSCDKSFATATKCPHIGKAVSFNKIKKYIIKTGMSIECATCKKNTSNSIKSKEEECAISSGILICLQCGHQGCGKEQCGHALEHYKTPHSDCHSLAVETVHWNLWCFECEIEVNIGCRKKLQETIDFVKRAATAMNSPSQNKVIQNQLQKETVNVDKNQKEQILYNLPKVGGLMNLGNTCFFNAVLQCLAQTPFLVKVLEDLRLPGQKFVLPGGKHKPANSSEEIELPPIEGTLEGWQNCSFTSILCKTLTEMQNSDGRQAYRPSELLNSFKKKTMQCMDGGQHDSHELLRHLLEIVRNEDLRRYQSIILKEVGLNEKTNPEGVEDSLKSRVKFYGNQASARLLGPELVFRGVLVSTVECLDCHHTSQSMEPFLDLSLPVMADKPQPPVLKKNSGFEDSFNVISHSPSKCQPRKETPVRKNRKNRKQNIINIYEKFTFDNNIAEENNGSILESEKGDADVEDNIEAEGLPEVAESGCSSEKQSALASPASPSTDVMKSNENMNELPLNNGLQMTPTNNLNLLQLQDNFSTKTLPGSSPTNACVVNSSQPKVSDGLDSSESVENESEVQTGFSLSTSLAVNSNLTSPEVSTISPSSISSEESPNSPISGGINGENGVINERPVSKLDQTVTKEAWDEWPARRKIEEYSNEVNNTFDGLISEISKIIISSNSQQSPIKYPTKEGECLIQSCLKQFAALELMSGSNKVGCEACTAREKKVKGDCKMVCTPSTKQYLISRVPAVLILHLKRFQAQRIDFRKVTRHVSFPTLLDLSPICKNHKKPRIYALYGVVEHSGTIHGGHYVAYVKSRLPLKPDDPRWSFLPPKDPQDMQENSYSSSSDSKTEETTSTLPTIIEPPPGKWYYVSDSRVSEVDETTVLQSQAYLLFYERIF